MKGFGYCPGRQDPTHGQPKIIVQPARIVFLNDKDVLATSPLHPPDWFGRFRERSFAPVCCERHCRALMLWDFGIHDNPPMLSTIRRQLALDDLDLVSRHRGGSVAPAIANVSHTAATCSFVRRPELSKEQPCVLLIVFKQPGANVIETADLVQAALPQMPFVAVTAVKASSSSRVVVWRRCALLSFAPRARSWLCRSQERHEAPPQPLPPRRSRRPPA